MILAYLGWFELVFDSSDGFGWIEKSGRDGFWRDLSTYDAAWCVDFHSERFALPRPVFLRLILPIGSHTTIINKVFLLGKVSLSPTARRSAARVELGSTWQKYFLSMEPNAATITLTIRGIYS